MCYIRGYWSGPVRKKRILDFLKVCFFFFLGGLVLPFPLSMEDLETQFYFRFLRWLWIYNPSSSLLFLFLPHKITRLAFLKASWAYETLFGWNGGGVSYRNGIDIVWAIKLSFFDQTFQSGKMLGLNQPLRKCPRSKPFLQPTSTSLTYHLRNCLLATMARGMRVGDWEWMYLVFFFFSPPLFNPLPLPLLTYGCWTFCV